ncbi:hypothetical protein [Anaeroselena agilis]|uniref:Uncharacterized protein n=1 Tax=Anaeroselena agilis TaxID=3063788 RepID=A0ABU3NZH9_9FIRM|nr:hypothetical protein [Selenomonadales bacterium 4137-cl]
MSSACPSKSSFHRALRSHGITNPDPALLLGALIARKGGKIVLTAADAQKINPDTCLLMLTNDKGDLTLQLMDNEKEENFYQTSSAK